MITKVLVNRIQPLMPKLVGPNQNSFIPGRSITDNVILAQEVVHSMQYKRGRKGWMLLKLDLERAYDMLRWDFIIDTLHDVGLPECWIGWISECITTSSMRVLWNGEMTAPFLPSRGIRQGDPISPYLFVLCLERLSHLIYFEVEAGNWLPLIAYRNAPKLSHLFFADDILLMAEAPTSQMKVILDTLNRVCTSSGLRVSKAKSKIFVSSNVNPRLAVRLNTMSGFEVTKNLGNYLGVPILHERVKADTFSNLLSKANARLAGWKCRTLSFAGRLTLAKSVLSSLSLYMMNSVKLPSKVCKDLDKIARIRDDNNVSRKPHLVAWEDVCMPKKVGGLGIQTSEYSNMVALGKLGWKLVNNEAGIWGDLMKAKYGVTISGGSVTQRRNYYWSHMWRSLKWGIDGVVMNGVRWNLGDGLSIRFWEDVWITDTHFLAVLLMLFQSNFLIVWCMIFGLMSMAGFGRLLAICSLL